MSSRAATGLGCCLRAAAWRLRSALTVLTTALLVAACTHLPPAEMPPLHAPSDASTDAQSEPALRPLSRQPGTPADAPRSRVPQAHYELAQGRAEDEAATDDELGEPEPPGEVFQRGGASWYGIQFHRRLTANGERFDMDAMTAAHKSLPFNSRVCVRSSVNGREVLVRVNDRGPFVPTRVIDVSRAAAQAIDMIDMGIKQVTLSLIGPEGGRCAGADVPALSEQAQRAERSGVAGAVPQAQRAAPARQSRASRRTARPRR